MANTYTQIHIQAIFAVKFRIGLVGAAWKEELYKYITGIVQSHNHKMLAINGMPDHLHAFFGMRPTQSLSDLMREVKGRSATWVNEMGFVKGHFEWQSGYGAFSYAKSDVKRIAQYVINQEMHHRTTPFMVEYETFLKQFDVAFDERYIFHEPI